MALGRLALASFMAVMLFACTAGMAARVDDAMEPPATLTVTNDRFYDAAIFLRYHGSTLRRVGDVVGHQQRTFLLTRSDLARGTLELYARYVGDGMAVVSDEIPAQPGAHYVWQLGPARGHDFLSVRYAALDSPAPVSRGAP